MKCRLVNENFKDNYTYNLLTARGVKNVDEFIATNDSFLQDPFWLENIKEGAQLLLDVIDKNGKILIVVDSDNDGFTSGTIIYQYIKNIKPYLDINYILHEGKQHGLEDHIDKLLEDGHIYDLIILPDSSSNDKVYHDQLASINTKCLVLDHHITDTELSNNAIIINNQLSPNYNNKELTGAGIAYQFCRYLDSIIGSNYSENLTDLAAWGVSKIALLYLFR